MTLKRPVTLPQARRWPAAAARRESFCARMGGMRKKLTGERAASDPRSKINQALAAWDCDEAELLQRKHVSKGIRPMKITQKMVGREAMKNPRKPRDKVEPFPSKLEGYGPRKGLEGPFLMRNGRVVYYDPAEGAYYDPTTDFYLTSDEASGLHSNPRRKPAKMKANPDTWGTAPLRKVRSVIARQKATGELPTFLMAHTNGKRVPTPYHFGFRLNLEGENLDFVGRYSGPLLIVSEKSTGLRLPGDVPFSKRSAYGNDKEAAKSWTLDLVERVGARKLVDKVKAAR